ncbi:MAG: DEAD/DEAH box helicase [Promethearchaeota archaeon]|jgi:Fanconi anemia group M protein
MSEIQGEPTNNVLKYNKKNIEFREYQLKIAEQCAYENSLVVLPTGLGKTIIAVLVTGLVLKQFPKDSKIIVLAPTRPLINQHYETFSKFLPFTPEKFSILTGKTAPEKRVTFFSENQILFYTPQTLRNDLVNQKYSLKDTALIIFDEAHHASGEYPYGLIADTFSEQCPDGIILALTASPGASKNKVTLLCENLHIDPGNIHIRTRKDQDVKTYIKPMDVFKVGVTLTALMDQIYSAVTVVLEERLQYLSQLNFLPINSEILHTKIIRKDLLKLNRELVTYLKSRDDKTGLYTALSVNAQCLILYHMLELVEQQGLDVLLSYLEKVSKDAKRKTSSKAVKVLASDYRIRQIFLELKKNSDNNPTSLIHPKFHALVKILVGELHANQSARILVFVKLRESVKNITNNLKVVPPIKPVRFVGQATKSQEDKGLSQKQQIEILDQFKDGQYNVLVSTNVGEEGLDIAECDLVIFYDVVASEIRLIQRKGRTARHREGKVIILYCKGTHDENYLRIALNKLKKMNVTLKKTGKFKDSESKENGKILPNTEIWNRIGPKDQVTQQIRRGHQTNLTTFTHAQKIEDVQEQQESFVKISKDLPIKFGLRKQFIRDSIEYKIVDSDLDIVLLNKVLIQLYLPHVKLDAKFLEELSELKQICELLIILFDFINFQENFEGEKRIKRRDLQSFFKEHKYHLIIIDNEQELYFVINNILDTQKG